MSKGSERAMWNRLRPVLQQAGLDPHRMEVPASQGVPDVNTKCGWIELKFARDWPVGEDTPLRLDHFTPQQRVWLLKRWQAGGMAWLLLHVREGDEWLLFTGRDAAEYVGKLSRSYLTRVARVAVKSPSHPQLLEALSMVNHG